MSIEEIANIQQEFQEILSLIGLQVDADKFDLNFYVDDIKLEDGKRGSRLSSQIYQEIMRHFKKTYPDWGRNKEIKGHNLVSK